MANQEYSILSGILVLERFTVSALARYANLSPNTVASWLKRRRSWFVLESGTETGRRGRPQNVWRLAEGREAQVRQQFEKIYPAVAAAVADTELAELDPEAIWPASLRAAWESLAAADRARADDDVELVRLQERTARAQLTLAWEEVEDYAAAGVTIPPRQIDTIVEMDLKIGTRRPPALHSLTEAAAWIREACRRDDESRLPDGFLADVMAAQARRLPGSQSGYLTGGLLVALARATCETGDTVVRMVHGVLTALGPQDLARPLRQLQIEDGLLYRDEDELFAVVIGVKQHPTLSREAVIIDWLQSLPHSANWQPRLAPVVLCMLAEAPAVVVHRLVASFGADLDGLEQLSAGVPDWSRRTYGHCVDYARRAVAFARPRAPFAPVPPLRRAPPAEAPADPWSMAAWSVRRAYEIDPSGTGFAQRDPLAAAILSAIKNNAPALSRQIGPKADDGPPHDRQGSQRAIEERRATALAAYAGARIAGTAA